MPGTIAPESILRNGLLDFILVITSELGADLPLPVAALHDLVHDILFRILVRAAQVLHEFFDRCAGGDEELDVRGVVFFPECRLPGLLFGFEDVNLAVLLWEGIVVSRREADTTSVIAEVDAREAVVRERDDGRICGAAWAEPAVGRHEDRLPRESRVLNGSRSRPAESLGRSGGSKESWVLRRAERLSGSKARWCGAVVKAVEGVETSTGHRSQNLESCRDFWGYLSWWCTWWRRSWIESVCGVEALTARRESVELLVVCDTVAEVVVNCDGLEGNKLDDVQRFAESRVGQDDSADGLW